MTHMGISAFAWVAISQELSWLDLETLFADLSQLKGRRSYFWEIKDLTLPGVLQMVFSNAFYWKNRVVFFF